MTAKIVAKSQPLYVQIRDYIKQQIFDGEFKFKNCLPSETELMKFFKVSRVTARAALKQLEEDKLISKRKGARAVVCYVKKPKKKVSKTIGLILPEEPDYFSPIAYCIRREVEKHGYQLIHCHVGIDNNEEEDKYTRLLVEKEVKGMLIYPSIYQRAEVYEKLRNEGIPFVHVAGFVKGDSFSYVAVDNFAGGYIAAKYLIELGYKNIGYISNYTEVFSINTSRQLGYETAMKEAGLSTEEMITDRNSLRSFTFEETKEFLTKFLPAAFVCYDDETAERTYALIKQTGLNVPDDISLVGFDDSQRAKYVEVPLTSVKPPKEKLAEKGVEVLLDVISGKTETQQIKLQPALVIRNSCRKVQVH